jgi:hypothetical protein
MLDVSVAVKESLADSMVQLYVFSVLIKSFHFIVTFITDEPPSYRVEPLLSLNVSVIITVVGHIVGILFFWGWFSIHTETPHIEMFSGMKHSNVSIQEPIIEMRNLIYNIITEFTIYMI